MIYLDNASTTFPKPEEVITSIEKALREGYGNPGRSAGMSGKVNNILGETRELISEFINAPEKDRIIFTYSATDSLNLAIKGFLKEGQHVITTELEHNSVLRPLKFLEISGVIELTIVEADETGRIQPEAIQKEIKENTALIVTTHASNVTGIIVPIEKIGLIAAKNNIRYLVDASQSIGMLEIDVQKMNIDMLAFPGHKNLFAPAGTGGLYIKSDINLEAFRHGGTGVLSETLLQPEEFPYKYESGTNNLLGITGLNAGIKFIQSQGINNIRNHEQKLFQFMVNEIRSIPGINIYGDLDAENKLSVASINIEGMNPKEVGQILSNEYHIISRAGLHCAPLVHNAMGTGKHGTVRLSIGYFNTMEDVDYAVEILKKIAQMNKQGVLEEVLIK